MMMLKRVWSSTDVLEKAKDCETMKEVRGCCVSVEGGAEELGVMRQWSGNRELSYGEKLPDEV